MDMVHPTNTVRKSAYNYFLGGSIVVVEEEEDQWQQVEADSASCRRAQGLIKCSVMGTNLHGLSKSRH
jgi:ATP sulfurylase